METAFQAVRPYLDEKTSASPTHHAGPAGLFITVIAHMLLRGRCLLPRRAARHPSPPMFVDALTLVRINLWTGASPFSRFRLPPGMAKPPPRSLERLRDFPCHAA